MSEQEIKILIVASETGFLITSIADRIKADGFKVTIARPNVDILNSEIKNAKGVLICVNDDMIQDTKGLIYLRDKAIEEDISLFLYGDKEVLDNCDSLIGNRGVTEHFIRPVEVGMVAGKVKEIIEKQHLNAKKKVLVVDDSGAMLRNVKEWLQDKYQVILANSGTMAVKYLAINRPDLVLLDYEMPVLNGKQVLEMIRSESEFADIPVIFLTGRDDRQTVMDVVSLKPQGYMLKTLPPEQIVAAVDDFFMKQKKL